MIISIYSVESITLYWRDHIINVDKNILLKKWFWMIRDGVRLSKQLHFPEPYFLHLKHSNRISYHNHVTRLHENTNSEALGRCDTHIILQYLEKMFFSLCTEGLPCDKYQAAQQCHCLLQRTHICVLSWMDIGCDVLKINCESNTSLF